MKETIIKKQARLDAVESVERALRGMQDDLSEETPDMPDWQREGIQRDLLRIEGYKMFLKELEKLV